MERYIYQNIVVGMVTASIEGHDSLLNHNRIMGETRERARDFVIQNCQKSFDTNSTSYALAFFVLL